MYLVSPYGAICRIIEQVTKVYETFKIDAPLVTVIMMCRVRLMFIS